MDIFRFGQIFFLSKYTKFQKYSTIFIITLLLLFVIFFIYNNNSQKKFIEKESNQKNENKIKEEIKEKDRLNEIALKTKLIPYPCSIFFTKERICLSKYF